MRVELLRELGGNEVDEMRKAGLRIISEPRTCPLSNVAAPGRVYASVGPRRAP
jgi:hypothetical protein